MALVRAAVEPGLEPETEREAEQRTQLLPFLLHHHNRTTPGPTTRLQ